MKTSKIFNIQDSATSINVRLFKKQFQWCERSIELMLDTHMFLANDSEIVSYRKGMSESDVRKFEAMNVVVNLAYDAFGSLISALRLMEYGVLADAWSLIRGAFESTCYAEFFTLNTHRVVDYMQIAETIKQNRSADIRTEITKAKLGIQKVMEYLQERNGENRTHFYSRLCNFGAHASPVRAGLRVKADEPEVRVYCSINHRELPQCIADFAATAKYVLGIPFEAWPDLMERKKSLFRRYRSLLEKYKAIYEPP